MPKRKPTIDGVEILNRRYVKGDPKREAAIQREVRKCEVGQLIYDLRTEAGLSQGQLAKLVGTRQSVISRLEDADYSGHSLAMLDRITAALDRKLTLVVTAKVK